MAAESPVQRRFVAVSALCCAMVAALFFPGSWNVPPRLTSVSEAIAFSPAEFLDEIRREGNQCGPGAEIKGHCYCPMGRYGRHCDKLTSKWAVRYGLPARLGKHSNWNGFLSPQFKMRYQLAASALKRCRRILEIGAYKTPITEFVDGPNLEIVTAIDPNIRARYIRTTSSLASGRGPVVRRRLAYSITDYDFQELKEDCLIYLGLPDHNHISPDDLRQIESGMASKRIVVFEIAANFGEKTIEKMQNIIDRSNKHLKVRACMDINFTVPGNRFELLNERSNKPWTERRLCYFATDAAAFEITVVTPDPETEVHAGTPAFVLDNVPRLAKGNGLLARATPTTASSWVEVRYDALINVMKNSASAVARSKGVAVLSHNGYGHGLIVTAIAAIEAGFGAVAVDSVSEAWAIREEGGVRLRDQGPEGWRPFEGGDVTGLTEDNLEGCHGVLRSVGIHLLSQPPESEMVAAVLARTAVLIEDTTGLQQLCNAARRVWSSEARMSFRPVEVHIDLSAIEDHFLVHSILMNCTASNKQVQDKQGLLVLKAVVGRASQFDSIRDATEKFQAMGNVGSTRILRSVREEQTTIDSKVPGDMTYVGGCMFRFMRCGTEPVSPTLRWFARVARVSRDAAGQQSAVVRVGVPYLSAPNVVVIRGNVCKVIDNRLRPGSILVDVSSIVRAGGEVRSDDLVILLPSDSSQIPSTVIRIISNATAAYECGQ